jgi:hypothetical protein
MIYLFLTLLFHGAQTNLALANESDFLARQTLQYRADDPRAVLDTTVQKLRDVFRRYRPVFDSGTTVISPLKIGGSQSQPTMNMVVRKCVLFICETVEIDATIRLRERSGSCERNFTLEAELSRSSKPLTDNYEQLRVESCFRSNRSQGSISIEGYADRARTYSSGPVSNEIVKMLGLQVEPMSRALLESLKANGGTAAVIRR